MYQEFSKGWTDPRLWMAFKEAMMAGDCAEIAAVVHAQGAERPPVDAFVMAAPRQHRRAENTKHEEFPDFNSPEFLDELDMVVEMAELRDEKLSDLPMNLPRGMRELSPILAQYTVPKYKAKKNYGTKIKSIQAGEIQTGQDVSGTTKIITARDASSYVHKDNSMTPWVDAAKFLLDSNAPMNLPTEMNTRLDGQSNFTVFGMPFIVGLLGTCLLEGGLVSFRAKWSNMRARPEEASVRHYDKPLKLAYAEGSPMHPSMPAMHSFAAWVQYYLLITLFDKDFVLPNGETVEQYLTLLADNIGYFRVLAGVHYPSDHTAYKAVAAAVAASVAAPYLR